MNLKAVLFDLDGTLLPMADLDAFTKTYFYKLTEYLTTCGYEPKTLMGAVLKGVNAIMHHDGTRTNERVFWDAFATVYGECTPEDERHFAEFYEKRFDDVRVTCGYCAQSAETVAAIRAMGLRTALATKPVFPEIATRKRMAWAGLTPDDFEFYTTYENSCFCKPNLEYYQEVLDRMGILPEEALMVGNDVEDDMVAASLGIRVFLLTDYLVNNAGEDITKYPHGGFDALMDYIREQKNT